MVGINIEPDGKMSKSTLSIRQLFSLNSYEIDTKDNTYLLFTGSNSTEKNDVVSSLLNRNIYGRSIILKKKDNVYSSPTNDDISGLYGIKIHHKEECIIL